VAIKKFRSVDFLPRSCLRERRRYEKQTYSPDSFDLLWVEMLFGGEICKNHDEEVLA
jgi:hypothetical protein